MGDFSRIGPYEYSHTTAAATTTVKSLPGLLHTIQVNGGTLGAITVYDDIVVNAARIIAVITPVASTTNTFVYDIHFSVGLTIVTAAATDLTVSFT